MNFIELVKLRQSIRRYDPRPVEMEKIMQCIEAARLAPSASNSQPWHFVIVNDPDLRQQVAEATFDSLVTFNRFMLHAPVIIVLVTEKQGPFDRIASRLQKRDLSMVDNGIAAEHFCLQAAELGLGTCIIGRLDQRTIKKILHIPAGKYISLLISMGYLPEDNHPREKIRKPVDTITSWNLYEKP